ncbi:MAG: hypothetical protein A2W91_15330 [Bacteroidetes bacterium GWF2_38_335]|nr:MAG: hypothetical protein A2W91_15330 [Bacteroidetes bacterium GWF2_38_335]OFY81050.1 MAG: hypothetical protein A2281_13150 [Bacteroidetes bacterium RIFOXYA12_FULL_38_20]HBS87634.1 hypothetical protein [Bacteroidales bacterium]
MRWVKVFNIIIFLFFSFTFCKAQLVADTFNVPQYHIPDIYYTEFAPELPATVNNRLSPFFPPDFYKQNLSNCNQAAGHYYCLTYQFNRLLNRTADSLSCFSPNYTYNFLNGGNGWYGASTFDTWNIVKSQGNPTEAIFDGYKDNWEDEDEIFFEGKYWMNSYDKYYQSMKYRIKDYYSLDVSTDEGLKMLKHYLSDHFEGAENGGVAVFFSGFGYLYGAPFGYVYDSCISYPFDRLCVFNNADNGSNHSMTIAGYYENTEVDFNGDGIITDTLDLNSDGNVNYLDNEKTLWIIVNSYGEFEGKGAFLLRYSQLTKIWDKKVFIPIPDTAYTPKLTFKIRLKHNQRNTIKISAGISSDLKSEIPEKIIDFPIFNYQGGNWPLTGVDTLSVSEELEFGIDITDILDYLDTKGMARIFFRLENAGHRSGELEYCSLMDYSGEEVREYVFTDQPVTVPPAQLFELYLDIPLQTNASEEKLNIVGDNRLIIFKGDSLNHQISFTGGSPPYKFKIVNTAEYEIELTNRDYTYLSTGFTSINNEYITLDWPFPYAGEFFDSVAISTRGTLTFSEKKQLTEEIYPYNFFKEAVYEDITISAYNGYFFTDELKSKYFLTDSSFIVWHRRYTSSFRMVSRIELFKDGRIEIYFMDSLGSYSTNDLARHFGISTYSGQYFSQQIPLELAGDFNTTIFKPKPQSSLFSLSNDGFLEMPNTSYPGKHQLHVMVIDSTGEKAVKRFEVEILDRALDLALYPNPASEQVTISLNSLENNTAEIDIFDISGKLLLSKQNDVIPGKNEYLLDISMLSDGIYLCKIKNSNLSKTLKFAVLTE